MKTIKYLLPALFVLFSCEDPGTSNEDAEGDNNTSVELFEIAGEYQMNYGPHDLVVSGNYVFACRDDIISVIDLSDVSAPALIKTINDVEASNDFESLVIDGTTLFAGCASEYAVYAYDISDPANPIKTGTFKNELSSGNPLKPLALYKTGNTLWVGGSNGSNGVLAKLNVTNLSAITAESYYILTGTGNAGGGVYANTTYAFLSTANGKVLSFDVSDVAAGIVDEYTFSAEAGHEHWGYSLLGDGNNLYWADWGAGIATLDISNPSSISAKSIITHSTYTTEHPEAEGTNAYDIALDKTNNTLYVANGWSGLLTIDINNSGSVKSFVDYKENQYRCIALYGNYAIVGDISTGITNKAGIKIIRVK